MNPQLQLLGPYQCGCSLSAACGRSIGEVGGCCYSVLDSVRSILKVQRSEAQRAAACVSQPQELLAGVFEVKLTLRPSSLVAGMTGEGLVEGARESDVRIAALDARFVSHGIWM